MTHQSRCKTLNKNGLPCRAPAMENGHCYVHSSPQIAGEMGRRGGRRNRHTIQISTIALANLDSAAGVRETIAQVVAGVLRGPVNPKTAASLAPLLNTLLRTFDAEEKEEKRTKRLEALEKQFEAFKAAMSRGELTAESEVLKSEGGLVVQA